MNYFKITLVLLLIVFISSCKDEKIIVKKDNTNIKTDSIYKLTNSKANSEGVFLFKTASEILINWTEWSKIKDNNVLKFAFFNKQTNKFEKEITVLPSAGLQIHAESMAKVGITKNGIIYAIYRKKSKNNASRFGGFLYYSLSKDKGVTWSDEKKIG